MVILLCVLWASKMPTGWNSNTCYDGGLAIDIDGRMLQTTAKRASYFMKLGCCVQSGASKLLGKVAKLCHEDEWAPADAELVILVRWIPISQGFVVSAAPDFLLAGIRRPGSLFDMLAQGLFSPDSAEEC